MSGLFFANQESSIAYAFPQEQLLLEYRNKEQKSLRVGERKRLNEDGRVFNKFG